MRIQVGNWREYSVLCMDQEGYETVAQMDGGRFGHVRVEVDADRRVRVIGAQSTGGMKLGRQPVPRNALPWAAEFKGALGFDFLVKASELPRFELMFMDAEYDWLSDQIVSSGPLPVDHELPWPNRRAQLGYQDIKHQVSLRITSSLRSGGHGHFEECKIPLSIVRDVLPRGDASYMTILHECRRRLERAA